MDAGDSVEALVGARVDGRPLLQPAADEGVVSRACARGVVSRCVRVRQAKARAIDVMTPWACGQARCLDPDNKRRLCQETAMAHDGGGADDDDASGCENARHRCASSRSCSHCGHTWAL